MTSADFVEVYRASDPVDAHLVKHALADAGIAAHITGESAASAYPNLSWACPRVLVAPIDAERANTVIREHQSARKSSEPNSQRRRLRNGTIGVFIAFSLVFAVRFRADPRLVVGGILVLLVMAIGGGVILWKQRGGSRPLRHDAGNSN